MDVFLCLVIITNLLKSASIKAEFIQFKQEGVQKNFELCKKFAKDPYFETELVIGKPWRVYYTWNVMGSKCLDIVFRNATPTIILRIWSDMNEYMEEQPYWKSAALHLITGVDRHELLLFPAQGEAGGFTAVPNVIRSLDMTPAKNSVPLLKFQLKLVRNGRFLAIMNCHDGVTFLAAIAGDPPCRSEIASAAAELNLGDGHPACTQEKNKEEQFFVK